MRYATKPQKKCIYKAINVMGTSSTVHRGVLYLGCLVFLEAATAAVICTTWGRAASSGDIITFIIPSCGRSTLSRSLDSLIAQETPNWRAIVVFDGPDGSMAAGRKDRRITYKYTGKQLGEKNHAGAVRNMGLDHVETKWVGFLDDDDTVTADYVSALVNEVGHEEVDAVVFRMRREDGSVVPPTQAIDFSKNEVGISFALRMEYVNQNNVRFVPGPTEDFDLLRKLRTAGAKVVLSPFLTYRVRQSAARVAYKSRARLALWSSGAAMVVSGAVAYIVNRHGPWSWCCLLAMMMVHWKLAYLVGKQLYHDQDIYKLFEKMPPDPRVQGALAVYYRKYDHIQGAHAILATSAWLAWLLQQPAAP